MQRKILETSRYRKDLRRQLRRGKDLEKLVVAVDLLVTHGVLPHFYKPHQLQGLWVGCYECHIETDWLLVYALTGMVLTLYRTGTHTDLFE